MELDIIMKETNKARINEMFKKVEGRATARTADYSTVLAKIEEVEKRLYPMSKANMTGTEIIYDCSEQLPNAYKWIADGTQFKLLFKSNQWHLTEVTRGKIKSWTDTDTHIILSDTAKTALLKNICNF